MEKVISVIVPIYNSEKYLNKCIDSILNQSYKNFELLLIDDGSKDNSLSICNKYAALDSRVKVHHKENEGIAKTRNYPEQSCPMMEVMLAKKKPMSELAAPLKIYPQVLENVRVTDML